MDLIEAGPVQAGDRERTSAAFGSPGASGTLNTSHDGSMVHGLP